MMRKLVVARKLSQFVFFVFFVYIFWSTTYPMEGSFHPSLFFSADPNLMIFASISERTFLPAVTFAVFFLVIAAVFGRFFCGWICPLGAVFDVFSVGKRKERVNCADKTGNRVFRKVKFVLLGVTGIFALYGVQVAWVLDPMVIAARFVSMNLIPTVTVLTDNTFVFLMTRLGLYDGLYPFYLGLKSGILGASVNTFSLSGFIFAGLSIITIISVIFPRAWCRGICPLGAILALASRSPLLRRNTDACISCGDCLPACSMGAIKTDAGYYPGECILCMDCIYECSEHETSFSFGRIGLIKKDLKAETAMPGDITRKQFLFLALSSFLMTGGARDLTATARRRALIRPPGVLDEKTFFNLCIRCGNCMKVCPTNVLQPTFLEGGGGGIWTPHLVNEIGYCEYNCDHCGKVCPTGAIPALGLPAKKKVKLGIAKVDRTACLAWGYDMECLVCEEHCPVPDKAIKIVERTVGGRTVLNPYVIPELCIGCGICQNKCPASPERAIKVDPSKRSV